MLLNRNISQHETPLSFTVWTMKKYFSKYLLFHFTDESKSYRFKMRSNLWQNFHFWLNYQSRVCFWIILFYSTKYFQKKPSHQALCCQPIQQKRGCEQNGVTAKSTAIKTVFFLQVFFAFPAPCSHKTKQSHFHSIPLTHTHTHGQSESFQQWKCSPEGDISALIERCTANQIRGPELSI